MEARTEGRLANYLFNGTTMRWSSDGSRTPLAILSDLESTGEGLDLWEELTTTVSAKRRHQMRTSNDIDSVCLSGPGTTLISREVTQLIPGQGTGRSLGTARCRARRARGAPPPLPPHGLRAPRPSCASNTLITKWDGAGDYKEAVTASHQQRPQAVGESQEQGESQGRTSALLSKVT
jgi:hypothetical protein